jgi:hypothetical protein
MSTSPTFERASADTKPSGRNLRWLWIVALVVVIAIAGIVLWLVFSGDDEAPALTFDGATATYIGPTTLEAGTNTFSLDNTHDTAVDFGKVLSTDENLTMEDVRVWSDPNATGQAAWFGGWEVIGVAMAGEVVDYDIVLSEGTYGLLALDRFTGIFYPAAVIQVTAD